MRPNDSNKILTADFRNIGNLGLTPMVLAEDPERIYKEAGGAGLRKRT